MKIVRIKKLYKGAFVSLADYEVDNFVRDGVSLIIKYGRSHMTLSPKDLEFRALHLTDKVHYSKRSKRPYKLIDYKFKPENNFEIVVDKTNEWVL